MGNESSSARQPLSLSAQAASLHSTFPHLPFDLLKDLLLQHGGDVEATTATIVSFYEDSCGGSGGAGEEPAVVDRQGYDALLSKHVLRHSTPQVMELSLAGATLFLSRAKLAKRVCKIRREKQQCGADHWALNHSQTKGDSDILEVAAAAVAEASAKAPLVRSPSLQEREKEMLRQQMSREEKIEDGMKLLRDRVDFMHLNIKTMEDDGNCQFRAIADELFGHQRHHDVVRKRVVEQLRANSDSYSFYVGGEREWGRYLDKMSQSRTWGDELTLKAASEAFRCKIHVVTTEQENWILHYNGEDEDAGATATGMAEAAAAATAAATATAEAGRVEKDSLAARHLFLCYVSPIHYNVLSLRSNE